MDIGHMARPFIEGSKLQKQEAKTLELRAGQVVRGVVLQVLDDQEAIVSINGTPVKARLETPLQPGQASWMQVQPETSGGVGLVLKTVKAGHESSDEMIARQLKELGLRDTPQNRELLRQASEMGIELRSKDAKALAAFLARQDAPIDSARWIQSALITMQRGLPLTAETVQSIAQAVHGKPLPQLLTSLLTQLGQLSEQPGLGESTRQWIGKMIDGLDKWLAAASGREVAGARLASASGGGSVTTTAQAAGPHSDAAGITNAGGRAPAGSPSAAGLTAAGGALTQPRSHAASHETGTGRLHGVGPMASHSEIIPNSAGRTPAQAGSSGQSAGERASQASATSSQANGALLRSLLQLLGIEHERQILDKLVLQQAADRAHSNAGRQPAPPPPGSQDAQQSVTQLVRPRVLPGSMTGAQTAQQAAPQAAIPSGSPLAQTPGGQWPHPSTASSVQQPGVQQILQPAVQGSPQAAVQLPMPASVVLNQQPFPPSEGGLQQPLIPETIKSLLLQAANHDQLPQALRESVQQAIQSITGQQLLMSADRAAPITYITLFVPFVNVQGEHMASVHIQTRKGRRGGLDSDNCHLLFDLRMSALGDMMIDVQVTERIVALQIYNDHPLMQHLAEEGKQPIQQALADMGYRLSAMKVTPMPESRTPVPSPQETVSSAPPIASELKKYTTGSAYKGVDLRI